MYNKYPLLVITFIFILTGCANKFFPDKKLYQYPEKTNDMAVVYPDGTIHHNDGSITKTRNKIDDPVISNTQIQGEEDHVKKIDDNAAMESNTSNPIPVDISAKKDATGRHARHREGEKSNY